MQELNEEEVALGLLFASFYGNIRTAAAIVNYNQDDHEHIERETGPHLEAAFSYLNAFIESADKESKARAKLIRDSLKKYGLETDTYRLAGSSNPGHHGPISPFIKAVGKILTRPEEASTQSQ
jgi:hypothetical protein